MKKQTTVMRIRNWVRINGETSEDGESITYSCASLEKLIREAKAMEKEQMLELISFVRVHNKMGKTAEDLLEQFEAYKGGDK